MKNPGQTAWCRTTGWAAAVVALAAACVVAPSTAHAACTGDCNGDGEVAVNELVLMVNIALGSGDIATCTNGDVNNDGQIEVNEIVAGVNSALNGCIASPTPTPSGTPVCGNGQKETGEDCDDGGICIGGDNAGTHCTAESDCHGEGVCDSFGSQGPAGTVLRKVCSTDNDCAPAKCIHCKTFGGDGCAANCTAETETTVTLVTGVIQGQTDITPGTSGAVVHGDILTIPLVLAGTNALIAGKPSADGTIPVAQKVAGINLPAIAVGSLACACVRGSEYKTCGGTQFEADGQTASTSCTSDPTACNGKKPCTSVAGPGNSGEGVIGCAGLPSASYSVVQDAGGDKCPNDVVGCQFAGQAQFTAGAAGGAGAQVLASASAIGTVVGLCTGTSSDYGADGTFCTDDDPDTSRGTPSIQTLVTGTASAKILGANGIASPDNDIGPFSSSGNAISCEQIAQGHNTGAAQAGAFTSLDQPTTGDIVVTNVFVSQ